MTLTQILLSLGLVALATFIYRYWKPRAWLKTYQGRTLMAQKFGWFLLISHFLIESIFPYPGHETVELFVIGLTIMLFWGSLIGLLLAQGVFDNLLAWVRRHRGKMPLPFRKVSRKRGQGYVLDKDIERTQDKRKSL